MTGEDSRFPLTKAAAKYTAMRKDGRWLSNRAAIEVVRGRIMQLLERIDANEASDRLGNLYTIWTKMRKAEKDGDGIAVAKMKIQLDEEFEGVYHDYASWKQLFEVVDLDRKLTESEVKIVKDLKAMLTAEDANEFAAKLLAANIDAINGAPDIPDSTRVYLLKRINYEFGRITGYGDGQPSSAGAERRDPEIIDA